MLRRNVFGLIVDDIGTPTREEVDVLYILECAKDVGMEVIEGKTACSISFCAEIMRRLRENNDKSIVRVSCKMSVNDEKICSKK